MSYTLTEHPCVYQDETGRLQVRVTRTSPKTGKRTKKIKTLPAGTTIESAILVRDEMVAAITGGQGEQSPRLTLGAWAEEWMDRRGEWMAPSAARTYRSILRHHILPELGDIYADCVERRDLLDWVSWCESRRVDGEPYAQQTLDKWRRVATTLLKDLAADMGIPDPTVRVRRARGGVRRVRSTATLTLEELRDLLVCVERDSGARYAEVVMMAYTGMRSGEVWALHWDDVDGSQLHVHRTVSAGVLRDTTKTGYERHVYAPEPVREALELHRRRLIRRQHRGLSTGLVFPSDAGTPRTTGSIRKVLIQGARDAGITKHVSPQVLRRSFNTLLVESAVDGLVIRSQMGHSDVAMTAHYFEGHIEAKQAAVDRILAVGV